MHKLKAIWDGDVLCYQIGFAASAYWEHIKKEKGIENDLPPPWHVVEEMLEDRMANAHAITNSSLHKVFLSSPVNFRNDISTTGYKLRRGGKPYHYYNIKAVLRGVYGAEEVEGLEADDLLAIEASKDKDNTIIIGIDKDLLQVDCWHYLYEYGNVPSFGPLKVEGYGDLVLDGKKLRGYGSSFFLFQCLTGDNVDSIIGIPGVGIAKAYKLLKDTKTYEEGLEVVIGAYKAYYGDDWKEKLLENGRLLYMTRELDKEGGPVLWHLDAGLEN